MKIIFDYNRTIFDPENDKFYPGALDLIENLSFKHKLFLVSYNEPGRKNRAEKSGLSNFFQRMEFVDNKSEKLFSEIIQRDKKVVVVGDNIRSEIRIGNRLGSITVRVKSGKFSQQKAQSREEIADYDIKDIRELDQIIKKYE